MAGQNWVSLLSANNYPAPAALSTAATAIISPVTSVATTSAPVDVAQVSPAGFPLGWYPGFLMRVTARGYITTVGTTSTLTYLLQSRIGNTGTNYVTLATSTTLSTTTTVYTGLQWKLEALVRCTGINKATAGDVSTQGEMSFAQTTAAQTLAQTPAAATVPYFLWLPSASGETSATVDTTQYQGINLACTQTNGTCTIQLTEWLVEALD